MLLLGAKFVRTSRTRPSCALHSRPTTPTAAAGRCCCSPTRFARRASSAPCCLLLTLRPPSPPLPVGAAVLQLGAPAAHPALPGDGQGIRLRDAGRKHAAGGERAGCMRAARMGAPPCAASGARTLSTRASTHPFVPSPAPLPPPAGAPAAVRPLQQPALHLPLPHLHAGGRHRPQPHLGQQSHHHGPQARAPNFLAAACFCLHAGPAGPLPACWTALGVAAAFVPAHPPPAAPRRPCHPVQLEPCERPA